MKVCVFGLGYVGCVSAACLAREGHHVIGVDVNQMKVDMINEGRSPIVEKGLEGIIAEVVEIDDKSKGCLYATSDGERAVVDSDISLICVGTPSNDNGSLKLDYIRKCAREIAKGIRKRKAYHVVVARSTMLPGSAERTIIREIEYVSGMKVGRDFGMAVNPEFLRESTSVSDFYNPPVTVVGEIDKRSGDAVEKLYYFLDAPTVRTDIKTAEMIKYANNAFHALKVSFANEIGVLCKAMGIDSHKVMDIFCMDHKLNLSSYYLKPGFAFGGSCLPKDVKAIVYKANEVDAEVPVLRSVLESNRIHIERAINKVLRTGKKKVGILGLSFKAGTDDLRESPLVVLAERLIGKGFDIRIYDENVTIAKLFGANKEYIETEIPHISSLMSDQLQDVISHSDVIVIGNKADEFRKILGEIRNGKKIYDLVRIMHETEDLSPEYEGICW